MRKKLLWVLVLLTALFGAVNICSAEDLTLTGEEFYTKFCDIAKILYGSSFCRTRLEETGEGFIFQTRGRYTIKLYTKSPELNLRYAKIYFSIDAVDGDQLWTALLSFFLAADNSLENLTYSHLEFLHDYIQNLLTYRGKIVYYDRIQIYGDIVERSMYFTAHGR